MSTEAWIFMVGLRVFDVGALVVWLVWFFRLRDEDDDEDGGDGPGNDRTRPRSPKAPAGRDPAADADPWPTRLRDHTGVRTPAGGPRGASSRAASRIRRATAGPTGPRRARGPSCSPRRSARRAGPPRRSATPRRAPS